MLLSSVILMPISLNTAALSSVFIVLTFVKLVTVVTRGFYSVQLNVLLRLFTFKTCPENGVVKKFKYICELLILSIILHN